MSVVLPNNQIAVTGFLNNSALVVMETVSKVKVVKKIVLLGECHLIPHFVPVVISVILMIPPSSVTVLIVFSVPALVHG